MDLLELSVQTQDHASLCRAQGKIVWKLDNAAFKFVNFVKRNVSSLPTKMDLSKSLDSFFEIQY